MDRRTFFQILSGTAVAMRTLTPFAGEPKLTVQTVRGPRSVSELGLTLPHEHVLVDFVGAAQISKSRYRVDDAFALALPPLQRAYDHGVRTVFECTPAFLGRDVGLLTRLSEATGINLVTNTGLYGARTNLFLPEYAHTESARQLAARWIFEAQFGIDGTSILPGFIKSGVDPTTPLSAVHRKLVEACALTHLETGLTIAVHTNRGPGLEELDVLKRHGVAPAAFLWVHAQGAQDEALFEAADRGAWLGFDGLNTPTLTRHLHLCTEMKKRGHLDRVLLSHDAGWFDPAKPAGGFFRPYDFLFTSFLPQLRNQGFTAQEIDTLLVKNPAKAYAQRERLL